MRKPYLLLAFVPAAIAWACGGDDSGVPDGGGQDATTDSGPSNDGSSNDSSTTDSSANDGGSNDATSNPDVSITLDCFEPANCVDGGDPDASYPPSSGVVCCGTVTGNGVSGQSCQLTSASTTCKAPSGCATDYLGLLSCSTATVRLCRSNAECTENGGSPFNTYDKCCVASAGDAGSIHVCANNTIASQSNGRIVCP